MERTYRQTAEGSFKFRFRPGTPHCGPSTADYPAQLTANYQISIEYENACTPYGYQSVEVCIEAIPGVKIHCTVRPDVVDTFAKYHERHAEQLAEIDRQNEYAPRIMADVRTPGGLYLK